MALDRAALLKTTLLDYPGEVASVVFTPRCNLRCPYCHNSSLVENWELNPELLEIEEIHSFLKKRARLIGGVVITGGEPLIHEDLGDLVAFIHSLNLKVKIDTNGLFPERLISLTPDYIAMDIKTSPEHYYRLGLQGDRNKIYKSIDYIIASGIPHEFRTTVAEEIVKEEDISAIAPFLKGAEQWFFTPFRPGDTLDPHYRDRPAPSIDYVETLVSIAVKAGINASVR